MKALLNELFEILDNGASEYLAASVLFRLYAHFFKQEGSGNRHVLRAQEIIRSRFMQPIKIEDIAHKLHLDRRYLSWLFKKETGERAWVLKDSFYNNSTERQTVTARGSLVQRELSAKLTEGLFLVEF